VEARVEKITGKDDRLTEAVLEFLRDTEIGRRYE
jgi:hypothetical protein